MGSKHSLGGQWLSMITDNVTRKEGRYSSQSKHRPGKTQRQNPILLTDTDALLPGVLCSHPEPVGEQPYPQQPTHPTVEGSAAPEVSSVSRGSFL